MARNNIDPGNIIALQVAAEHQRLQIKEHLTKFVLHDSVPIDDEHSFFQIEPPLDEEEQEVRDYYERAKGDAGLYAIQWALGHARHRLAEAQHEGWPEEVELARSELEEVTYLEQAYTDPANNPFMPIDGEVLGSADQAYPLSEERGHLDEAAVLGEDTDPPF